LPFPGCLEVFILGAAFGEEPVNDLVGVKGVMVKDEEVFHAQMPGGSDGLVPG
jgi:hypothetical protein